MIFKKVINNILLWVSLLTPTLALSQTVTIYCPNSPVYASSNYLNWSFNIDSPYQLTASTGISVSGENAQIVYASYGTSPTNGRYNSSFQCRAKFSGSGPKTLSVSGAGSASCTVNVLDASRIPPSVTIVTNEYCGSTAVVRREDPPAGWLYYWQTNSTDYGSMLGTEKSILLYTQINNPLYVRAYNTATGQWSDATYLGNVVVYKVPPVAPTVATNATEFEGNTASLSVGYVNGAMYYNWYNAAGNQVFQGTLYTKKFTKTETFYVATSNGCESAKLPVTITILPLPRVIVQGGGSVDLRGGAITLATFPYTGYTWKYANHYPSGNGDGSVVTTSSTCAAATAGYYWVEVTSSSTLNKGVSPPLRVGANEAASYIMSDVIQVKGISDPLAVDALPVTQKTESIQYFDGMGRANQTVITQGSPLKKDIVQSNAYDAYGRESSKYLPFVLNEANGWYKTDPIGTQLGAYKNSAQYSFYQGSGSLSLPADNTPYAKTIFENSPLSRVLDQGNYGAAWQTESVFTPISDASLHWNFSDFLTTSLGGGGGVNSTIQNKILTIQFSAGFSSTTLKTGPIKLISKSIQDCYLGPIAMGNYNASLRDGYLFIEATTGSAMPVTGFGITNYGSTLTYTVTLKEFESRKVSNDYLVNDASEVIKFTYDPVTTQVSSGPLTALTYYSPNTLSVSKTTNEDGYVTYVYKNMEDQIVLKRAQVATSPSSVNDVSFAGTYYVYDDFGNLVVVLPPEAVKALTVN